MMQAWNSPYPSCVTIQFIPIPEVVKDATLRSYLTLMYVTTDTDNMLRGFKRLR